MDQVTTTPASSVRFSVIMPCYNCLEYTIQAVQSILRNTEDFELILVDDGSTDETLAYMRGVLEKEVPKGHNVLLIHNDESIGFTSSANIGARASTGQYIIIVNNDIVVTPYWAARMAACLDGIAEQLPIGQFGLCGPVSNYVAGMQLIPDIPKPFPLEKIDEFGNQWHQANQQRWVYTGFLSGFCLMAKRHVWEELGGFDDLFTPGGYEDNDICVRAYQAGYKSIIAGDTFVYHYGTKSTSLPERAFMQGGLHNRGKYYAKYWQMYGEEPIPIVCGYRVKNAQRWMRETLKRSLELFDHICILDDGSTDKTPEIIKQLMRPAKNRDRITYIRHERPFQELRDRNELWSMMSAAVDILNPNVPGWGVILDADEVIEDKVTRDYLQNMARPIHPDIHGYIMKIQTFWRGRDKVRVDDIFGNLRGVRMVRFAKDQKLWTPHPQGLHCGNTPTVPPDWLAMSNVNIRHYGFEDYALAEKKYEFYSRVDTVKDPQSVGGDGSYRHLIDETHIGLAQWHEQNTIGLAVLCKDEGDFLPQFFERNYFFSLFDQIVLMDCGSTDSTREIGQVYGAEVYDLPETMIFQEGPFKGRLKSFGMARNYLKAKMKTRLILMMDADEYFDYVNLPALLRLALENDYHAFRFHIMNHQPNGTISHSENFRLYRNIDDIFYTQHVHESLEISLARMGPSARTATAPFPIHHMGYLRNPQYVQIKLDHYEHLNEQDLRQDPADARPYFNLALHYLNEGENEKAVEYLSKSCELLPTFMQAFQEFGKVFLRRAMPLFQRANQICPNEHPSKAHLTEIVQFMDKYAQEPLRVGQPKGKIDVDGSEHPGSGETGPDESGHPDTDDEAAG